MQMDVMNAADLITDVKIWVIAGVILGIMVGIEGPSTSVMLTAVLVAQMTMALHGLRFTAQDLREDAKGAALCFLCCYLLNTGLTLLTGLLFIGDRSLWFGWIMLASVPCAVSVVSSSLIMGGDTKLSVIGLTVVYFVSLGLAPLLTHLLIGDAVNPVDILKYIVLFIAIPFAVAIPLGRVNIPRAPKIGFINLMMFLMLFMAIGSRRTEIFQSPETVLWLVLANLLRLFAFGMLFFVLMKRMSVSREKAIVYDLFGVWRNSGMSISMSIALLG